jgi:hypothetical protein
MKGGKNKMLNKRGMSDVVMTVIMIGLVLIAIGVVWISVQGILNKNTNSIDYNQKCLGLGFEVSSLGDSCQSTGCTVTAIRSVGSSGEAVQGFGITFSNTTASGQEILLPIIVSTTVTRTIVDVNIPLNPTKATLRWYFDNGAEKFWCPTTTTYPKA